MASVADCKNSGYELDFECFVLLANLLAEVQDPLQHFLITARAQFQEDIRDSVDSALQLEVARNVSADSSSVHQLLVDAQFYVLAQRLLDPVQYLVRP